MCANIHQPRNKVRLTVECSIDERTYIKMLAAKKQITISELLLNSIREMIPPSAGHNPNAETVNALKESRRGKLKSYKNINEFWEAMGIDPNA